MVKLVKDLQPLKAARPILVREVGKVTLPIMWQSLKALLSISVVPSGMFCMKRAWELLKSVRLGQPASFFLEHSIERTVKHTCKTVSSESLAARA